MPNRVFRAEINSSASLSQVSMGADLLFRCLICVVDDYGRGDARLPALKAHCFPMRDVPHEQIAGWLEELTRDGCVQVWEHEGRRYLWLTGWETHRGNTKRAKASRLNKKHPVLWDKDGKQTKRFKVPFYPCGFLVDGTGKIVWWGSPNQSRTQVETRIARELKRLEELLAAKKRVKAKLRDPNAKEPSWLTEKEALARAARDGKWVFLFKYWSVSPESKLLYASTLARDDILEYLHANFHCVIAGHPKFSKRKRESALWACSDGWDRTKFLWAISPDGTRHIAIEHRKDRAVIDPKELMERLQTATAPPK